MKTEGVSGIAHAPGFGVDYAQVGEPAIAVADAPAYEGAEVFEIGRAHV